MNLKFLLTIIAVLGTLFSLVAQQDLRQRVAIVRPVYQPSTVAFLTNFSRSLKQDGYENAARMIDAYLKGGFGSGFVIADKQNGNTYIITNKHVVAHAENVTVEFTEADKSVVTYTDCPVIAIDENTDLAAVALPAGVKRDKAFDISTDNLKDGAEVYSAGYPGLNNVPAWQLGKGIVSNSEAQIKELEDQTGNKAIIQHTAQIDPGSSGGPLMIRNAAGEYEVAGINTWKATGASTLNMAIPASAIRAFINENIYSGKTQTTEELKKRVSDFILAAQTDYRKLLPFISYSYIQDITADAFYNLLNTLPEKIKDAVTLKFQSGNPLEGLRIGLAGMISRQITAKNTAFKAIENFTSTSECVNVALKYGTLPASSAWVVEQGRWRIRSFSPLIINPHGKQGIDADFGYDRSFRVGTGMPLVRKESIYFSLIYAKTNYTFMTYDARLSLGASERNVRELSETSGYETFIKKVTYIGLDLSWGAQLPVKIGALHLMPHLKGIVTYDLGVDMRRLGIGFAIGNDIAYKIQKGLYLIGGIEYRHKFYAKDKDKAPSEQFTPFPSIGINVGIAF